MDQKLKSALHFSFTCLVLHVYSAKWLTIFRIEIKAKHNYAISSPISSSLLRVVAMQLQWFNKSYYHHHFAVTYTVELISILIIKIIKIEITKITFQHFEKLKEATKSGHQSGGGIKEDSLKRRHQREDIKEEALKLRHC